MREENMFVNNENMDSYSIEKLNELLEKNNAREKEIKKELDDILTKLSRG